MPAWRKFTVTGCTSGRRRTKGRLTANWPLGIFSRDGKVVCILISVVITMHYTFVKTNLTPKINTPCWKHFRFCLREINWRRKIDTCAPHSFLNLRVKTGLCYLYKATITRKQQHFLPQETMERQVRHE